MAVSDGQILNRVAQSGILTLNLEDYRPAGERMLLDIKDQLFMGLMLREKDFRAWAKTHDWTQYTGKHVALWCSADAIVPAWAYMLLASLLAPYAKTIHFGTLETLEETLMRSALDTVDWSQFSGQRVVLKGCGTVSPGAYAYATFKLVPHVAKLMYGEPCSTVPIFKTGATPKED